MKAYGIIISTLNIIGGNKMSAEIIRKADKENKFVSLFDPKTGFYMRSGVIENGVDTGEDPFMADFPELIDIGVMGACEHGKNGLCSAAGIQCYQDGLRIKKSDMLLSDFKRLIDECEGRTYQVALGGRGDPNMHQDFGEMVAYCRAKGIVPNYTTSGYGLTEAQVELSKAYCGAVAVSWYGYEHTQKAIQLLLDKGVKTNVHFVLSNTSIELATALLRKRDCGLPKGVNAIVFLLHKPIGLGQSANVLNANDIRVHQFFKAVERTLKTSDIKIGFDSCTVSGIINYGKAIDMLFVDTCEAARWSMYISSELIATPCSFDVGGGFNLKGRTITEAWKSEAFDQFRNYFKSACGRCKEKKVCLGGCPIAPEIVLCERTERTA